MTSEREALERALAEAESARERLEAALVEAKAALMSTVTDASRIDAIHDEAFAKVEKARARCRELRAAIANPVQADFITRSRERIVALIRLEAAAERPAVTHAAAPGPERAAVDGGNSPEDKNRWQMPAALILSALTASQTVREALCLLALVLAYLQYYFLGVQLEIMLLPSVTPFPLQG